MARPEGYRKAIRLMDLADRFRIPVITLIDTAGAYPGKGAEERGQAEAIARSTEKCLAIGVPLISVVIGEGGSGGAVAFATANRVAMLEHSVYSVISPEGCASILWKDAEKMREAAEALRLTAQDLQKLGIIDRIVKEPLGGAQRSPKEAVQAVGKAIEAMLSELSGKKPEALIRDRRQKFLDMGSKGLPLERLGDRPHRRADGDRLGAGSEVLRWLHQAGAVRRHHRAGAGVVLPAVGGDEVAAGGDGLCGLGRDRGRGDGHRGGVPVPGAGQPDAGDGGAAHPGRDRGAEVRMIRGLLLAGLIAAPAAGGTLEGRLVTFTVETWDDRAAPLLVARGRTVTVGRGDRVRAGARGVHRGARRGAGDGRDRAEPDRAELSPGIGRFYEARFNGYVLRFETDCALFEKVAIDPAGTTMKVTEVWAETGALYINVSGLGYGPEARLALDLEVADCPLS
jgi:hypothetical protein